MANLIGRPYALNRRELLAVGGSALLAACTRDLDVFGPPTTLRFPTVARSMTGLATECMRLDTNDLTGWQLIGSQLPSTSPTTLQFSDSASGDFSGIALPNGCAAPGLEVDVVASFQVRSVTPDNADCSFRVVINDGQSKSAVVCCVIIDGDRVLALRGAGPASEAGSYPASIPIDWLSAPVSIRLRHAADGGAELMELNGVAPNSRVFLRADQVANRSRPGASSDIGCFSPQALADVDVTEFYAEAPAASIPGVLAFTQFRIRDDNSNGKVRFDADYTLGGSTDGIDPAAELVTVRLSTPAYGQFYPAPTADFNPLSGFDLKGITPQRRWLLNAAEEARTGIEKLRVHEDLNQSGSIVLKDANNSPPAIDYSTVNVEIVVGNDRFTGTVQMIEEPAGSGRWRLAP